MSDGFFLADESSPGSYHQPAEGAPHDQQMEEGDVSSVGVTSGVSVRKDGHLRTFAKYRKPGQDTTSGGATFTTHHGGADSRKSSGSLGQDPQPTGPPRPDSDSGALPKSQSGSHNALGVPDLGLAPQNDCEGGAKKGDSGCPMTEWDVLGGSPARGPDNASRGIPHAGTTCFKERQQDEPGTEADVEARPPTARPPRRAKDRGRGLRNSPRHRNFVLGDPSDPCHSHTATAEPIQHDGQATRSAACKSSITAVDACRSPFHASDMSRASRRLEPPERVSHVAVDGDFSASEPSATTARLPRPGRVSEDHATPSSIGANGATAASSAPRPQSGASDVSDSETRVYKSLSKRDWVESEKHDPNSGPQTSSSRSVVHKHVLDPILTFISPRFPDKDIEARFRREVSRARHPRRHQSPTDRASTCESQPLAAYCGCG